MRYPNSAEVEEASRLQLAKWYRFLPSPGQSAINTESFTLILATEGDILDRIMERFNKLGGWTSELSKEVGHDRRP